MTFKVATGWPGIGRWLNGLDKIFRVAAGAIGIGCFGYPIHPVYEVTSRCNLHCIHCHARGGENIYDELDTEKAKAVIENIASVREFRMLVFTGGEPLVRSDIYDLINFAHSIGFSITLATNATLITKDVAKRLKNIGVEGIAASLDFVDPSEHDSYRGATGAFKAAINGILNAYREDMYIQINITMSKRNVHQLEKLLSLSNDLGASVVLLYQLIPFGRGEWLMHEALDPEGFKVLMDRLFAKQRDVNAVIVPVGLPEYFAFISRNQHINYSAVRYAFKGCIAGRGMFYVKPNGDVWPCPFLPINAGNLLNRSAIEIWRGNVFSKFKDRGNLKGTCGSCIYKDVCGGCRARAYAYTGDPFESDPFCPFIQSYRALKENSYYINAKPFM